MTCVTTSRAESGSAPTGTLTVSPPGWSMRSGALLVTTAVTTGRVGLTGGWPRPEARCHAPTRYTAIIALVAATGASASPAEAATPRSLRHAAALWNSFADRSHVAAPERTSRRVTNSVTAAVLNVAPGENVDAVVPLVIPNPNRHSISASAKLPATSSKP